MALTEELAQEVIETLDDGDPSQTDLFIRLSRAAIDFFEAEADHHLHQVSGAIRYFDGGPHGRTRILLPESFTSISEVAERDEGTSTWDVLDSSKYLLINRTLTRLVGAFPAGLSTVRVTYNSGYADLQSVPSRITRAIIDLVGVAYRTRKTTRPTFLPDGQVIPVDQIPQSTRKTMIEVSKWR